MPFEARRIPAVSCLAGMDLSPQQELAMLDDSPRVLVTAGAGSGKTRLLVAHFIRALLVDGVPPDRLVAVTFTRKAAAELASRIRARLEHCGRPDLARSLDAATIGTIHSLCRRLVRESSLDAGVDPAFGVLEAEGAALARERCSRRAWERVVEQAGDAELEALASGRESLRRETVDLYERLRGMGMEYPQVEVGESLGKEAEQERRLVLLEALREALAAGRAVTRAGVSLQQDLERLESCLEWLEQPVPPAGRDNPLMATAEFFPSRRTRSMEVWFAPVRESLTRYRQVLAQGRLLPLVNAANTLLAEFHEEYVAHKRERGVLDFADLELRARALVQAGNGVGPPVLTGSRLLVDEFQDTNELQCGILEGLGADRLLMVGDERQSIYRFRGADVSVFRERERELRSATAAAGRGGAAGLHRLDVNYRSCPEIIDFVNRLFAHGTFFGPDFFPLEVSAAKAAAHRNPGEPPAIEIVIAGRTAAADPEGPLLVMQQAEAGVVAACVRRAVDEEGWRQRDIVVLLPAQTNVEMYRQALTARGIRVYVVRGKGYYSQEEVADATSLLRLLVNPHDDLALVATLRSPLAGLSDDALYLLGREGRGRSESLWQVIREGRTSSLELEDQLLLATFVRRLSDLRRRVGRPGLAQLIDDAVTVCGYDLCVLAAPEGARRFANLRKLMRIADEFESIEGPDLAAFVDLLESIGAMSDQEGSAPTLAEGEDLVRIMTVHQAKGLEFPMVVLAGLGSDVHHDSAPRFVVGEDGRMGVFLKDSAREPYESSDLCWGPAAQIVAQERAKELEEDTRLMYVAMTRAEERLVLLGARPKDDGLGRCRIGRIATGLGLSVLPPDGQSVRLEGLDAVVRGMTPFSGDGDVRAVCDTPGAAGAASDSMTASTDAAGFQGTCPTLLSASSQARGIGQVSFSALAAYQRCPRRYYLERVLGLSPPAEQDASVAAGQWYESKPGAASDSTADDDDGYLSFEGPFFDHEERDSGRDVGLLVHALLERLPPQDRTPGEARLREVAREWLEETGVQLTTSGIDRAVVLTTSFLDSPVAGVWSDPAALREAPFVFVQEEVMVSGVMDLVVRHDDSWHIVDYKTNALGGRSPVEVAANYDLQGVTYCLAALRSGAPAVRMDFVFLELPGEPVTMEWGREAVPRLEGILHEALEGLVKARFPARAGIECDACAVADLCANMALG